MSCPPSPAWCPGEDRWPAHYLRRHTRQLVATPCRTFRARPGVLESVYTAPFGTAPGAVLAHVRVVELLTHGRDLAWATGQPTACRLRGPVATG